MGARKAPASEAEKERRNRQRREARAAKANGAGKPDEAPPATGIFVVVERIADGGLTVHANIPQGDVRPAEVPTILEKAVKVERQKLALD